MIFSFLLDSFSFAVTQYVTSLIACEFDLFTNDLAENNKNDLLAIANNHYNQKINEMYGLA